MSNARKGLHIKILDTDKFFNDSPNAGEPDCICSRCAGQIKEGEKMVRVAVDEELIKARGEDGKEHDVLVDMVNGFEFRLCKNCLHHITQ